MTNAQRKAQVKYLVLKAIRQLANQAANNIGKSYHERKSDVHLDDERFGRYAIVLKDKDTVFDENTMLWVFDKGKTGSLLDGFGIKYFRRGNNINQIADTLTTRILRYDDLEKMGATCLPHIISTQRSRQIQRKKERFANAQYHIDETENLAPHLRNNVAFRDKLAHIIIDNLLPATSGWGGFHTLRFGRYSEVKFQFRCDEKHDVWVWQYKELDGGETHTQETTPYHIPATMLNALQYAISVAKENERRRCVNRGVRYAGSDDDILIAGGVGLALGLAIG